MGKSWQCPCCARTHETDDNIKYVICRGCLSTMKKVEVLKMEVEECDGQGNK